MIRKITLLLITLLSFGYHASAYTQTTDSLLNELKKPLEDSSMLKAFEQIIRLKELSNDSTILYVQKLMQFAANQPSDSIYTMAVQTSYACYLNKIGDREAAQKICWKLFERMKQKNYVFGMASACKYLGVIYIYHSLDSSMFYHLKCIGLFKSMNFERGVFATYINLGSIYMDMKKYTEALKVTKAAYDYFEEKGDLRRVAICNINLTQCYKETGQLDSAIKYAQAHIHKSNLLNNNPGLAHAHGALGEIYILKKEYNKAQKEFEWIINLGIEKPEFDILYTGYYGMAKLEFAKLNYNSAIQNAELALKNVPPNNLQNEIFVYEFIYKCYKEKGDYKSALSYYDRYITTNDSFQNADRLKKIDALEAKYQNKEKQTEIEILNKEKEIQTADVEMHQLIRNTVILICVILFAFAGLLFNRFKLKKKIESQQAIINERKRISNELHDDLGAQLSTARMFLNSMQNNADSDKNKMLVENSIQLIDGSISDLRKIMDDLQVSTLQEKGYIIATEELVNKINQLQQINFTLIHHGFDSRFDYKTEHNLFRVTQELINNTLKYAKAKNVSVDLLKRDNKIVLMYEDDGVGFDLQKVKRGYGLSNIESRIKSMNGELYFDTAPGNGFRTTIEMPL